MLQNLLKATNYLIARLKEPSSMTAISVTFAVLGAKIDEGLVQSMVTTLSIITGTLGFLIPESKDS